MYGSIDYNFSMMRYFEIPDIMRNCDASVSYSTEFTNNSKNEKTVAIQIDNFMSIFSSK